MAQQNQRYVYTPAVDSDISLKSGLDRVPSSKLYPAIPLPPF